MHYMDMPWYKRYQSLLELGELTADIKDELLDYLELSGQFGECHAKAAEITVKYWNQIMGDKK